MMSGVVSLYSTTVCDVDVIYRCMGVARLVQIACVAIGWQEATRFTVTCYTCLRCGFWVRGITLLAITGWVCIDDNGTPIWCEDAAQKPLCDLDPGTPMNPGKFCLNFKQFLCKTSENKKMRTKVKARKTEKTDTRRRMVCFQRLSEVWCEHFALGDIACWD